MTPTLVLAPPPQQELGRVAVLIPVYRDAGRLAATLASLADQGTLCTAVVVDDGSEPPVTIAPATVPVPVCLLRLPQNGGIERALNAGLAWIEGRDFPYVARLDNGDRCLPGRLAAQVAYLDAHPDVGLLGTAVVWETEGRVPVFTLRPPCDDHALRRAFHANCPLIHPTVCARTALVRAVGRYRLDAPAAEDYDLFWRLAHRASVACLPATLVATRFDPAGISLSRRRRQVRSRLTVQLRYARWFASATYLGLLRTLLLMVLPPALLVLLKRRRGGHGDEHRRATHPSNACVS